MATPRDDVRPLENEPVLVRALVEADLAAIVRIDASEMNRARTEYYRDKVKAALHDSKMRVSLVAELDGQVVGFLMAALHYGEFGRAEPSAVIDSVGVHVEYQKRGVGAALMEQFLANARAVGVERVWTEVAWNDFSLMRFLDKAGFRPGDRIVLALDLAKK